MTLNISFQSLLACKVSFEKSSDSLMGTPLQVTVSYSLAAFKILSFSLILGNLRCPLVCSSLGPNSSELSELPGLPGSLFPFPDWGNTLFIFKICFQFLAVPLLLLAHVQFGCWNILSCSRDF